MNRQSLLVLCCLACPLARADVGKDEASLRAAGVGVAEAQLLAWFRQRTPDEADRKSIEEQIRNLASRSFAVRERAFEALKKRGVPAIPHLKSAMTSADLEVARRAERCLAEIDRGPGPDLTLAAIRLLAHKVPASAVSTLVAFAPHAEDDNVEEVVLETLVKLSPPKARPAPVLIAALADDHVMRRGAAAYVLGRFSDRTLQANVHRLLADKEPAVRFRAAQGLLLGRDRRAVPGLIALLSDAPLAMAWQAEELLIRVAGENTPEASIGNGDEKARAKCRETWETWWRLLGYKVDLSQVEEVRRLLGMTLVVEYNSNRIWECGPEGLPRWQLTDVTGPMDAWVLPGHRVLVAAGEGVSERDLTGRVLRRFEGTNGANSCQRLLNGHTFVSTYNAVLELDLTGKVVYRHDIGGSNAVRKRRSGTIIYTTQAHIIEMDVAGKQVRTIPIPRHNMWVGLEELEGGRFLVANSTTGRVIEVDADGKIHWEANVVGACGIARLPTGTTLVSANQRIVELDRQGKVIWEKKATGYARRIHRR